MTISIKKAQQPKHTQLAYFFLQVFVSMHVLHEEFKKKINKKL